MTSTVLTQDQLKQALDYDPATGVFRWKAPQSRRVHVGDQAGVVALNGRRYINLRGGKYLAHHLAWLYVYGVWPSEYVRHRDENHDNNAIANLYEATAAATVRGTKALSTNSSGFRGVSFDKSKGKWQATITRNYRQMHLGYFETPEAAAAVYQEACQSLTSEGDPEAARRQAALIARRRRMRSLFRQTVEAAGGKTGWESLDAFIADVGDAPNTRYALMPVDHEKMIGPGNFRWALPPEAKFDHSTREGRIAYGKAHRVANQALYRDKELRKNFGITLADYTRMLEAQGGVCAICRNSESEMREGKLKALAVDHDHETGAVRALLCADCNKMIGHAREEVSRLRAAIAYIERHKVIPSAPAPVEVKVEFPTNFRTHALRDCGRVAA